MELYKIENKKLKKFNGGFVVLNNRIYTNPTTEVVKMAGYKELVYGEKPEYNDELQYPVEIYTEDDSKIYVDYELIDIDYGDEENVII